MKHTSSPFKWRYYASDIILLCVRWWYCRYQLSYRDLKEMMRERGLTVRPRHHLTADPELRPEINKRMRLHLRAPKIGVALSHALRITNEHI